MRRNAAGGSSPSRKEVTVRKNATHAQVAVEPCDSYDPEKVFAALKSALTAINFKATEGAAILLKPNIISQNTPDQATTTHPAVVDAVCRFFAEHLCRISIGDSSAFYQGGGTREGFDTTGIAAAAAKYGAAIIPFETTRLRRITSGAYLNPFYVTEAVFEHDLVVNLPKLKVHRLARYTGAVKNMYGCVVGGSKQVNHRLYQHREDYQEFWGKPLVDVYESVAPHLTVMDAVIGLDKDGPAATGEPRFTGLILASTNAVALDVVACSIIGFDPRWVPAVREALDRNLAYADAITVHGSPPSVPYVKLPDLETKKGLARKIDDYFFDQFIVKPKIRVNKCNRCGACVDNCAAGAIRYNSDKLPVIRYDDCISCYCCESYCRQGAIRLSGGAVNHFIRAVRYMMKL
ncbi:MAG: hypothetical protein A2176_00975 [Spirochaetes bacterium RBG_13_51_14]|nr:MAG: hypothetical protein A2176_00975 [Spirochaetes bacterium RBG_13_51_14]